MSNGLPAPAAGQMQHVIREALDAFAAPDVRERILARALFVAGLEKIPETGPALAEFVDRFLRQAMEASLDEHSAELAVQGLAPIVRLASEQKAPSPLDVTPADDEALWETPIDLPASMGDESDWAPLDPNVFPIPTERSDPPLATGFSEGGEEVVVSPILRLTEPPPAVPATSDSDAFLQKIGVWENPTVRPDPSTASSSLLTTDIAFASREPSVAQAFGQELGDAYNVLYIDSPLALLDLIQGPPPRPRVFVFDGFAPSVQLATLAAIAPDLPKGAIVLVWRATDSVVQELTDLQGELRFDGNVARKSVAELASIARGHLEETASRHRSDFELS